MSSMACRCGGIIRNHLIPCPTEGWLLRDQDQDAYCDETCRNIAAFFAAIQAGRRADWIAAFFSAQYPAEVSDESIIHDILCVQKQPAFLSVAECEQCGRLWVQSEPDINTYRSYIPDEPGYAGILRSRAAKNVEPGTPKGPAGELTADSLQTKKGQVMNS